jgi:hypothetical protein
MAADVSRYENDNVGCREPEILEYLGQMGITDACIRKPDHAQFEWVHGENQARIVLIGS